MIFPLGAAVAKLARILLLVFLTACVNREPAYVQEIGFWALGWHFTGTQNRIQPAIPPVLEFLSERYPGVRAAETTRDLNHEFQAAVLGAPPQLRTYLDNRMIDVFTVTGLPCAAASFPVRDHGKTVAAFLVLDAPLLFRPPDEWHPCPPVPQKGDAGRVEALRALLADLMNAAARADKAAD